MNDEIIEFISNIDSLTYNNFRTSALINSTIDCEKDVDDYDYSWLNEVEKYLPFVSNIVNGDYSKSDMNVLTSYENRFIRTLVYRLSDFLLTEQKNFYKIKFLPQEKKLVAHVKSCVNDEEIEVDIKVHTTRKDDPKKGESYGLSLKERIERVINITNSFFNAPFLKALSNVSFVHSPINKTPLFEEETNYRKSLELFNFIDNYSSLKRKNDNQTIQKMTDEKLLMTSFFEYQLLNSPFHDEKKENVYRLFLERIIEKMVLDSTMDEKSFKKMLTKKFEEEYLKKKGREHNIQNIFRKNIDNYNKQVKDALRALKN